MDLSGKFGLGAIILMFFGPFVWAQNLIPNGDFENGLLPCEHDSLIYQPGKLIEDWEEVYSLPLSWGYEREECANVIAYEASASGQGHIRIGGSVWISGVISSTFISVDFTEPLEAGVYYDLSFSGRSLGLWHPEDTALKECIINPAKDLKIFTRSPGMAPFGVVPEYGQFLMTDIQLEGAYDEILFPQPIAIFSVPEPWQRYRTCFLAKGGETQLGITGPQRTFLGGVPCENKSDQSFIEDSLYTRNRFYQFFYFGVDSVVLEKSTDLPTLIEAQDTLCTGKVSLVNLTDYLPNLPEVREITFVWEDGVVGPTRKLAQGGTYRITLVSSCFEIPLILDLFELDCPIPLHIPNVITPNDDQRNDIFRPIFHPDFQVASFNLSIYNRWGRVVYTSTNPAESWQADVQSGVYAWTLTYTLEGFTQTFREQGAVTVLR